ncbi:MAG TPA: hypothetical protein VNR87_14095 [Flavisolibacter sp.]|nr:hypothetical protein [Flavisolibacter sp.]
MKKILLEGTDRQGFTVNMMHLTNHLRRGWARINKVMRGLRADGVACTNK